MMDFRSGSPSDNSGAEEMEVSLAKPKHRVVRPAPLCRPPPGTPLLLGTAQPDHQSPGSEGADAGVPGGLGAVTPTLPRTPGLRVGVQSPGPAPVP